MANMTDKDLDLLTSIYDMVAHGFTIHNPKLINGFRQIINRLDKENGRLDDNSDVFKLQRYSPIDNSEYTYMDEDDAGAYIYYENMRQIVRLAIKWELTRVSQVHKTKLPDELEKQIDNTVRKFWEALGCDV